MKSFLAFSLILMTMTMTQAGELYLICADWCPPCQVQKKNMPKGAIILDVASPEGRKLLRGNKIPQTIYIEGEKRWDRLGVFNVKEWMSSLR